ncbi:MAG: hypothetical protein QW275_03195 [Candidatus Anstonellaceae archaeon]
MRLQKELKGEDEVKAIEAVNSLVLVQKKDVIEKGSLLHILEDEIALQSIGKHLRLSLGKEAIREYGLNLKSFHRIGRYALAIAHGKPIGAKHKEIFKDCIAGLYLALIAGEGDRYLFDGKNDSNLRATKRLIGELAEWHEQIAKEVGKKTAKQILEMADELGLPAAILF